MIHTFWLEFYRIRCIDLRYCYKFNIVIMFNMPEYSEHSPDSKHFVRIQQPMCVCVAYTSKIIEVKFNRISIWWRLWTPILIHMYVVSRRISKLGICNNFMGMKSNRIEMRRCWKPVRRWLNSIFVLNFRWWNFDSFF